MNKPTKNALLMKEIVDNAGIVASSNWLEIIIVFITSIIVVRFLGAELYGAYILGRKIFTVVFILAVFGLDTALVKFTAACREKEEKQNLDEILASSFSMGLGFAIITSFLLILASSPFESLFTMPFLDRVLVVFALALPFAAYLRLSASYFRGEKKLQYLALIKHIIPPCLRLAVTLILFFLGYRLNAVLAGVLITFVLTSFVGSGIMRKKFGRYLLKTRRSANLVTSKKILRYSSVLMGIQLLSELALRIDLFMVGLFLAATQVGIYGVVLEIALLFIIINNSLNQIFAPQISEAWQKRETVTISALYKFESKTAFTLAFPMFLFLFLYPETVLSVFGETFRQGMTVLIFISSGQLINCIIGGAGFILVMTGMQRYQLINTFTGLGINTALNLILIPQYGINGAAAATTVSLIMVNLMGLVEVKIFHGFTFYKKSFLKPLGAGILVFMMFKLIIPVCSNLIILFFLAVFFIILYFAVLAVLGLDEEESFIVNSYTQKIFRGRKA